VRVVRMKIEMETVMQGVAIRMKTVIKRRKKQGSRLMYSAMYVSSFYSIAS
jgi:hypothetical protein